MTQKEKRMAYFKQQENPDRILETCNTKDFLEVICKYGGDVVTFRVYDSAKEPSGFYITER